MTDLRYPFPTRDQARLTLERDYGFAKIPADKVDGIVDDAWNFGTETAERFLSGNGGKHMDFAEMFRRAGVRVLLADEDYVSGEIRYFAEYQPKRRTVTLYMQSIRLWADANHLEPAHAANLILMHEYFHYLENAAPEPASRLFTVPMLRVGPLSLGRTGIPALSEIAADAFAWMLSERTEPCPAALDMATVRTIAPPAAVPANIPDPARHVFWVCGIASMVVVLNIVGFFLLPDLIRFGTASGTMIATWLYLSLSSAAVCFLAWLGRHRPDGSKQALMAQGAVAMFHIALIMQNLL